MAPVALGESGRKRAKRISAADAAALVDSGDWVEYERHGVRASRVLVDVTPGNVITTTRADMMYVVTEYGIVNLKGKSIPERARAMISIAHPDFRDDLEREARGHRLIPKGVF
jgi:hypothetical protein